MRVQIVQPPDSRPRHSTCDRDGEPPRARTGADQALAEGEFYASSRRGGSEHVVRSERSARGDPGPSRARQRHDRRHHGREPRCACVQRHSIRGVAARRESVACASTCHTVDRRARGDRIQPAVHARRRSRRPERRGHAAHERRLPLPQRVDHGGSPRREAPRDAVDLRRRLLWRRGLGGALRRRGSRAERRGRRHDQLPARLARLLRASRAQRRVRAQGVRQLRHARRDRGTPMGAAKHLRVRRRSRERHGVRRVRRREHGRDAHWFAARERPFPARDRAERRVDGPRNGANEHARARGGVGREGAHRKRREVDRGAPHDAGGRGIPEDSRRRSRRRRLVDPRGPVAHLHARAVRARSTCSSAPTKTKGRSSSVPA